jgi:hypothetical protein
MNQPWRSKRHVQCRTATGTSTGGGHSSAGFHQRSSDDIAGCCCRDTKSSAELAGQNEVGQKKERALATWRRKEQGRGMMV